MAHQFPFLGGIPSSVGSPSPTDTTSAAAAVATTATSSSAAVAIVNAVTATTSAESDDLSASSSFGSAESSGERSSPVPNSSGKYPQFLVWRARLYNCVQVSTSRFVRWSVAIPY